jgi:hypothetical protein
MSTFKRMRKFWIPWVVTIVLACVSNAAAQVSYKVTDLGTNKSNDNFSMAMGLNNQGWTENMDGFVNPPENNLFTTVARGRAVINRDGVSQYRPGYAWKTRLRQQLDQLGRDQRPRRSRRYVRNICSRSEW